MRVTTEWLQKWATAKGGYTKRQLAIIGVAWPPEKGWKVKVTPVTLTDESAREFEYLSGRADANE